MAKAPLEIKSLARAHTEMAIRTLVAIAKQPKSPAAARVAACKELVDRGWGKAVQPLSNDGDKPFRTEVTWLTPGAS